MTDVQWLTAMLDDGWTTPRDPAGRAYGVTRRSVEPA